MSFKCVFVSSVYNRPTLTRSAIINLQKAMPTQDHAEFIIYNSGNSTELHNALRGINNVKVLDGESTVFWATGIRLALDKYFEYDCTRKGAIVFFNDDVQFDLPNLKIWMRQALLNLERNIASGSICVGDTGHITYSGFRKTFTRFHKITEYSGLAAVDALNFNLAMFPGSFIRQNYKNTFDFSHGYADIYTSHYYVKKGGCIQILNYPIGLCFQNDYGDRYSLSNMFKRTISEIYSDPKYYLVSDAKKFSGIFGFWKYYVFYRSLVGVFLRWSISHLLNYLKKIDLFERGKR